MRVAAAASVNAVVVAVAVVAVVTVLALAVARGRRTGSTAATPGAGSIPGARPWRKPAQSDELLADAINSFNVEHRSIELGRWLVRRLVRELAARPTWTCTTLANGIDFDAIVRAVPRTNPLTVSSVAASLRRLARHLGKDCNQPAIDSAAAIATLLKYDTSAFSPGHGAFVGFYPQLSGMQLAGYDLP